MIDFHSHVLPGMDDGADSLEMSLSMLRSSKEQGVDLLFATPHFYADESDPEEFLRNRAEAFAALSEAIQQNPESYPKLLLGAEVLYYPGMSTTEELRQMGMGNTPLLLVEPPMVPWTEIMLEEIEEIGENLRLIPVIAHMDRYMRMLGDDGLMERVARRKILIQVNGSYFLRAATTERAIRGLCADRFHFIGSDCHNNEDRVPNLAAVRRIIEDRGATAAYEHLERRIRTFLKRAQGS